MAPVVPTRSNVVIPICASSSIAMDADGPPMPVDITRMGVVPTYAIQDRYSRLLASSRAFTNGPVRAMPSTRPGSPGNNAIVAPSSMVRVRARW